MQKTKLGSKENQDDFEQQKKKLRLSSIYGEVGVKTKYGKTNR